MMHLISILPALGCVAMMFGGGFAVRLIRRTPAARLPWLARRASGERRVHTPNTRA
jgi:hypothetical protein